MYFRRILNVLIVAALTSCVCLSCSPPEKSEIPPEKPVAVKVENIKTQDLPVMVEASGRLAANREVTLAAEVGGVVAEYQAEVGESVEKGETLVVIDPTDYQLALNEAKAGLASAQAQLEAARNTYVRSKNLLPRKVISQESFERAEAEYKAARASTTRAKALVDIAEQRLTKTEITAPFAGLISARTVELGQTLAPGTPVMGLVDLAEMRVKIYVAERDYVDLDPDDPVSVTVEAYPDRSFKGRIDVIGVKADPQTNTFAVEVLVDNPELVLKAGLSARVKIVSRVIKDAILIPQSTVLYREDRQEVFVVDENNTAQTRRVTLGRNRNSDVEILGGLKPGDALVVMGGQYLKSGSQVSVRKP
jgi:RND family efflux transporter MFP subunit